MQAIQAKSLIVALAGPLLVAGCGDNKSRPDASVHHDAGNPDTPNFPAVPALGAQIDRAGRAEISNLLIGTFAAPATRTALRDAYNQASDAATWRDTMLQTNLSIEAEIKNNLAVFDAIDLGSGLITPNGCQNALRYSTPPGVNSYKVAADLLADDQIYVDTSRPTCEVYLALEIEVGSGGEFPHTTCGGRLPSHDVIDVTYSVLAAGKYGLNQANMFTGRIVDGVSVHPDIKDAVFPFLGPPH